MSTSAPIPWTPDFEHYSCDVALRRAEVASGHIHLYWEDGRSNQYDIFLLRENSPDDKTIHLKSREMLISPLEVPDNLKAVTAGVDDHGVLQVEWSNGEQSRYHPGWLRAHAWFDKGDNMPALPTVTECRHWQASTLPELPNSSAIWRNDKPV